MTPRSVSSTCSLQALFPAAQAAEWLRAGRTAQALALLQAHLDRHPEDAEAWHQRSLAHLQPPGADPAAALAAIRQALRRQPDKPAYRRQLAYALLKAGRADEAIPLLEPLLAARPDDSFALQVLQMACCQSGRLAQALELGRRLLAADDAASPRQPLPPAAEPETPAGTRRVVAFSLWGANPVYTQGAVVNARLAPFLYPDWTCRIYLGAGVPAGTIRDLQAAGAELVEAARVHADVAPSMWRFLVADDPEVAVFLCRDCDARLSAKEAVAVDDWLQRGRRAHIMRDHPLHRVLILAGLWGARTRPRWHMAERLRRFAQGRVLGGYGADQVFLAREVWPEIREDCVQHDSHYDLFGAGPFPAMGRGDDRCHVGMGVTGAARLAREARSFGL